MVAELSTAALNVRICLMDMILRVFISMGYYYGLFFKTELRSVAGCVQWQEVAPGVDGVRECELVVEGRVVSEVVLSERDWIFKQHA